MQGLTAQGCQVQLVKKSNMWLCNKLFNLCSTILNEVSSFFTDLLFAKMEPLVPTPNSLDILKTVLQKQDETLEVLALVCNNQTVLQNNIKASFKVLSEAVLDVKKTLLEVQSQAGIKSSVDLGSLQSTLTELLTNQTTLTNGVLDGFRLTGESLTRMESINFTERFATIIQNQGTIQTNLKAQVMSTGSELGGLITQLNVNVLSIPSESIAQATEFFTANPALANIVANALV
jgi:hypothetical protein